jgi:hypothetical protein
VFGGHTGTRPSIRRPPTRSANLQLDCTKPSESWTVVIVQAVHDGFCPLDHSSVVKEVGTISEPRDGNWRCE